MIAREIVWYVCIPLMLPRGSKVDAQTVFSASSLCFVSILSKIHFFPHKNNVFISYELCWFRTITRNTNTVRRSKKEHPPVLRTRDFGEQRGTYCTQKTAAAAACVFTFVPLADHTRNGVYLEYTFIVILVLLSYHTSILSIVLPFFVVFLLFPTGRIENRDPNRTKPNNKIIQNHFACPPSPAPPPRPPPRPTRCSPC